VQDEAQLRALSDLDELLAGRAIDYWLFGGWAVDFHAGAVSRAHDDLDLAVWAADRERIASLLVAGGWRLESDESAHGYVVYVRAAVRLELAFLARDEAAGIYTPLLDGRAAWPDGAFGDCVLELGGVRARVIGRSALLAEKAEVRDDPVVAAKDRADVETLRSSAPAG
jgi:Aminoglycoside-2''-adenylyltransferase